MATVEDLLVSGARTLPRREGIPDPRRESSWLLAHAWGVDELWLRLRPADQVPDEVVVRFRGWLERRAAGEPAHHLTGSCTFWSRDFTVSPQVLIPRPETELVVETALELPLSASARVLDIGTGTGCLAITLAVERPGWRLVAVDRSLAALDVARRNRDHHRAEVTLICGDLMGALGGGFDLVVANLPYLPSDRLVELPREVDHDPRQALDGGVDGLLLIRSTIADLPRLLTPCGGAVLELGEEQVESVAAAARLSGLAVARRVCDVGGCARVIVLQRR
jgi:release factor glutamine methyltransferase